MLMRKWFVIAAVAAAAGANVVSAAVAAAADVVAAAVVAAVAVYVAAAVPTSHRKLRWWPSYTILCGVY